LVLTSTVERSSLRPEHWCIYFSVGPDRSKVTWPTTHDGLYSTERTLRSGVRRFFLSRPDIPTLVGIDNVHNRVRLLLILFLTTREVILVEFTMTLRISPPPCRLHGEVLSLMTELKLYV
jgi:hypothetical protein